MRSLPELIAGNGGNQLLRAVDLYGPVAETDFPRPPRRGSFSRLFPRDCPLQSAQLGFEGMAELSGQAQFNNFGPALGQPPTALYLTTLTLPTLLVAVAIIDRKVLASTPQGVFYANFSVMGYELP